MFRRWFADRTERHYEQGIEHFNRGDLTRALVCFDRALQGSEDETRPTTTLARFYRVEALARLGEQHLARNRDSEALEYIEAALQEQPRYPDLYFRRGVALLRTGDPVGAENAARDALRINESFVEAQVLLALCLREQGEEPAARQELAVARAIGRRRPHALAAYLDQSDDVPSAEALWAHLFDEQARQERISEAELLFHEGRLRESEERLRELVDENPGFADLRLKLATVLFQLGEDQPALTHLERAIERNPRFADALSLAGAICLRQGDYLRAHEHFESACEAGMPTPVADYGLAVCRVLLGEVAASAPLLSAISEGENAPRAALELAACVRGLLGEQGAALKMFDRLFADDPDPMALLDAVALAVESGDLARAERILWRLFEEDGERTCNVEATYARAYLLSRKGEMGEALRVLSPLAEAAPEEPGLAFLLAELRAARGEVEAAVAQYRRALAADPEMPGVRLRLADLLRAGGHHADALAEIEQERALATSSMNVELDYLFALRLAGRREAAEAQHGRLARIFPLKLAVRIQDPQRWMAPLAPSRPAERRPSESSLSDPPRQPVV